LPAGGLSTVQTYVSGNSVTRQGGLLVGLGALWLGLGCQGQISGNRATGQANSGAAGSGIPGGPGTAGTGVTATGGGGSGAAPGAPAVESPSPRLLRQLTLSEYQSTVKDLLHLAAADTSAIPPDVSVAGFTTNVTGAFVNDASMDAYNTVAGALAPKAVAQSYASLVPCATTDTACASTFIDTFGTRAFRRPLTTDEKARYAKLFDATVTGGDFKTGVALAVQAMLVSPYFLFRSELGTDTGGGMFRLTPWETATALSYTFWGTMPDDALFAAARSGALAGKAEIETQARRLLADPRGRARIASFFYEWMESPRAYVATPDMGTYPAIFTGTGGFQSVVDAMRAEEDAFVTNVVFDSSKRFEELFTANYVFANDRLASFYGLPAPGSAAAAKKVMLPAGAARGGLLTLGMFLLGHARTNESSPTQRGHVIRANFLCSDVPPPPPDVDATFHPGTPGKTSRQQIEALTGTGTCAACHTLLNPIGYGLEGFGGDGGERTTDNGEPIDATGVINGFKSKTGAPLTFNGPRELSSILAASDEARRCMAVNFHRYARGYASKGVDVGAVQKLGDDFVAQNLELPELFVRVALQDSFITRRSAEVVER
jgi:hypothetical protein